MAKGITSDTHQSAIKRATAKVYVIAGLLGSNSTKSTKYKKRTGANRNTPYLIF
jgi:hypothetical protein